MNHDMRRHDRAVTTEEARKILDDALYITVAMTGADGWPYAVNVSFARVGDKLYFHSAKAGFKVDSLAGDGRVCIAAVASQHTLPAELSVAYSSAVGFGTAELVTDERERYEGLMALCKKYAPDNPKNEPESTHCTRANLYCIIITELTGKKQMPESEI
jgi:Predicted flavin-nucleotide-binding protein